MSDINAAEIANNNSEEITSGYILKQIEQIAADSTHINEALKKLNSLYSSGPGDVGTAAIAEGITAIVKSREASNQQLLTFYLGLFEDLRSAESKRIREKVSLISSIQYEAMSRLPDCLDHDELIERVDHIQSRIDALCTDILCDKL